MSEIRAGRSSDDMIVIEAALNGGRSRGEHPAVPCTPEEVAADALECAQAGASVMHVHAQTPDGGWLADPDWYVDAHRRIRAIAPDLLISITSIRPEWASLDEIIDMVRALSADPVTKPDLMSINLGHLTHWVESGRPEIKRETVHFPNSYEDITRLLGICLEHQIVPELGIMDLGFLSNAVALYQDGLLEDCRWFLIELDNPAYGNGAQVAPSREDSYELLASLFREHFPSASWAAHGAGDASFDIVSRAIDAGAHIRVGIEDSVHLPGATQPSSNAEQVAWAASRSIAAGRTIATPADARAIMGIASRTD